MITFVRLFLLFLLIGPFRIHCDMSPLPTTKKKQFLRTPLHSDILSLDPRKFTDVLTQSVIHSLFAGLVYLDKNGVPQLDLAKSYTISEDKKTYTFHLRDCKWSDGSKITAKDFEQSWKSLLIPSFVSKQTDILYIIKNGEKAHLKICDIEALGVYALDDQTLVIELEKQAPRFLDIISNSMFYPVHATMRESTAEYNPQMVSSGPFRLKNYTFQNNITLEKNLHFWDAPNISLEELQFVIIKDSQTALFMFEKGELDFICEITTKIAPNAIPSLKEKKQLQEVAGAGTQFLFINTQKFPMTNPNIRKAFAYAIDRISIMENILHKNNQAPSLGILPKIIKGDRWHPWFQDNDIKKAQEYFTEGLKELKITKKDFPTITIFQNGNTATPGLMEAIQQMWHRVLGCHVDCQSMDSPIFLSHIRNKNYTIGRLGRTLDYNDPTNLLDVFTSNNLGNYTGWSSKKYDQEVDAAKASNNEEQKWQHIENAEKIFCDEMPAIPLLNGSVSYIQHTYVKGVDVSPFFLIDFRKARIE
jgi:oligopeptide transport system substrate-binding protein